MKYYKFAIALLTIMVSSFFTSVVYSADEDSCIDDKKRVVFIYANGMYNKQEDINDSIIETTKKVYDMYLSENGPNGFTADDLAYLEVVNAVNVSEFHRSYNPEDSWYIRYPKAIWGGFLELLEVFFDYIPQTVGNIFDFIMLNGAVSNYLDEQEVIPQVLIDGYNSVTQSLLTATDEDLEAQIKQYNDYFDREYMVVTIAHSQGNIISKRVADYAIKPYPERSKDFKLISVGSLVEMDKLTDTVLIDKEDWTGLLSIGINGFRNVKNESTYGDGYSEHIYLSYLDGNDSGPRMETFFKNSLESFDFEKRNPNLPLIHLELFKDGSDVSMFVYERYKEQSRYDDYFVGKSESFVQERIGSEFNRLTTGFGEYHSSKEKDIYTLRCEDLINANTLHGTERDTVDIYAYILNEEECPEGIRFELHDRQSANGYYIEYLAEEHKSIYGYINEISKLGHVFYNIYSDGGNSYIKMRRVSNNGAIDNKTINVVNNTFEGVKKLKINNEKRVTIRWLFYFVVKNIFLNS